MTRTLSRAALAFACAAPFAMLGGCNLTASQAQIQAALNPGAITAGQLTTTALTAAGATPADITKAAAVLKAARTAAVTACGIEPSVSSVANIVAAAAGGSAVLIPAERIASIACAALTGKATFTAGAAPEKPVRKPKASTPKAGDPVKGAVVVGGTPLVIEGTVVDPSKAK